MKKTVFLVCLIYLTGCGRHHGRPSPPTINLNPTALSFTNTNCGSNPASQTFEITNAGDRTLAWSVSNLPAWLTLTPASGSAPSTITAQVNTANLACGQTYSQTIEVDGAGATNAPVSLTVTLTIPAAPPTIGISPATRKVTFVAPTCGGLATSASPSFEIVNTGSGSFNWSATSTDAWIQFAPLSGSAGAGVTVQNMDTANFHCGQTTSGVITITSVEAQNSPQTVTVEVVVPKAAEITPSTLGLGFFAATCKGSIDPQPFTIQNTGGTPLGWRATLTYGDPNTGWLSVDTLSGTVAVGATSGNITVAADASALTCGQGYSATLTLTGTSGGNNVTPVQPKTIQIGLSNPNAWTHQNPKSTSYPINDVTVLSGGVAWAVGDGGAVLRSPPDSPDYGNNWISVVSGTAANLHGIQFVSPVEGWIVGDSATILHTNNGGATWAVEVINRDPNTQNPITQNLQAVYFLDADHGWAVGDAGTILFRDSTGIWTATTASGVKSSQFTDIFMNDQNHGWITVNNQNESLLWTNDNWTSNSQTGQTGIIPQDQKSASQLYSVFFLPKDPNSPSPNRLEGWAVGAADKLSGNGSILHIYSDTGLDPWTTEVVDSGTTDTLLDLFMSNPNSGWAVGGDESGNTSPPAGTILRWNGTTWSTVNYNPGDATLPLPKELKGIASIDGNGVAVGLFGMVFTSANGTDWGNVSGPSINDLTSVAFAPNGLDGWAVGAAGTVLNTSNGGVSWVKDPNVAGNFTGLSVVGATNAWAVNDGRQIYHYGGSWGLQTTLAGSGNLKGVHFVDATHGWAVGRVTNGVDEHVYYYNGTSWSAQTMLCDASLGGGAMNSVYFTDANNGWAAGASGWIASTIDGGTHWSCIQVGGASTTWNAIYFVNASTGWAVGTSGTIYQTTDGGTNWIQQTSSTTATLFGVRFSDANNGWAAGGGGVVLYTQNGGANWTAQSSVGTNQRLNGLYAVPGGSEAWAVGVNGVILHTVSGGLN